MRLLMGVLHNQISTHQSRDTTYFIRSNKSVIFYHIVYCSVYLRLLSLLCSFHVMLKKIWSTKIPRGGGVRLSAHGLFGFSKLAHWHLITGSNAPPLCEHNISDIFV